MDRMIRSGVSTNLEKQIHHYTGFPEAQNLEDKFFGIEFARRFSCHVLLICKANENAQYRV